jgi:DNA-binding transcriptional regulator of glucitol operon
MKLRTVLISLQVIAAIISIIAGVIAIKNYLDKSKENA